jgi:hypothetical protein
MKFIIFLLFIFTINIYSQVVNIESRRMRTDTIGWSGSAKINFQLSKTTEEIFDFGGALHSQYKTKNDLWLFLAEVRLIKGAGTEFVNSGFAHLRYNRKITESLLRWEIFAQYQYNKALEVGERILAGTGPRFKIYDSDLFRLYCAALYMFEYQQSVDKTILERNHRSSSYVSFTFDYERFLFSNTAYYQPNLKNFRDYRILLQSELKIKIFKNLSFVSGFNFRYDSYPFPDVPKTTYSLFNGLEFEF